MTTTVLGTGSASTQLPSRLSICNIRHKTSDVFHMEPVCRRHVLYAAGNRLVPWTNRIDWLIGVVKYRFIIRYNNVGVALANGRLLIGPTDGVMLARRSLALRWPNASSVLGVYEKYPLVWASYLPFPFPSFSLPGSFSSHLIPLVTHSSFPSSNSATLRKNSVAHEAMYSRLLKTYQTILCTVFDYIGLWLVECGLSTIAASFRAHINIVSLLTYSAWNDVRAYKDWGVVSSGLGVLIPWKYVRGVRVCFDPLKMSHYFIQNCCWITLKVSRHLGWKTYVKSVR